MTKLVDSAAVSLANRTSRRGFLGRTSTLLVGLVGGGALTALLAGTAAGAEPNATTASCSCPNPCLAWINCTCGPSRIMKHYQCPQCRDYLCEYQVCGSNC